MQQHLLFSIQSLPYAQSLHYTSTPRNGEEGENAMEQLRLRLLRDRMETEVRDGILAYWTKHTVDEENGGFIGVIRTPHVPVPEGPRSLVLNTRILWTYATAYRELGDAQYLKTAAHAYTYLLAHFKDRVHGGYYWMLNADGTPADRKKVVYGNAFAIYALSEFARATGRQDVLEEAISQFLTLDAHAHDNENGGYFEGFGEDWGVVPGISLSAKDQAADKSMNTHLHVLEAFTNLLRVWDDPRIRDRHRETLLMMANHVLDAKEDRFQLFFDRRWHPLSDITSFGHDIEGSWLMHEAAEVLGDETLIERVSQLAVRMARRALATGMDAAHGGMYDEIHDGRLRDGKCGGCRRKRWWGFTNAWQLTGEAPFLETALDTWLFTDAHLVDHVYGEWFGATDAAGGRTYALSSENDQKVGPWKCPYHNARMCFEMISRINAILAQA